MRSPRMRAHQQPMTPSGMAHLTVLLPGPSCRASPCGYLGGYRPRGRYDHPSRHTRHELQACHGPAALLSRPRAVPLQREAALVNVKVCVYSARAFLGESMRGVESASLCTVRTARPHEAPRYMDCRRCAACGAVSARMDFVSARDRSAALEAGSTAARTARQRDALQTERSAQAAR